MTDAIKTYQFMRFQCCMFPVDACTDAASFHGINVYALAQVLIESNIDAKRLNIISDRLA